MLSSPFQILSLVFFAVGFVTASPVVKTGSSIINPTMKTPPSSPCLQPNLSDDPTKWSTRDFISHHFPRPIVPTPIFWSGRYNGTSVAPRAVECAGKIPGGGATIGMLMCQLGGFTMPNSSSTAGNALWDYASQVYAQYTNGTAYTVVGDAFVTSIWFDTEFPTLRKNTAVKSVISLDPKSCDKKCFWHCPNPSDCQGLKPCIIEID